jgi:hypothetical protein
VFTRKIAFRRATGHGVGSTLVAVVTARRARTYRIAGLPGLDNAVIAGRYTRAAIRRNASVRITMRYLGVRVTFRYFIVVKRHEQLAAARH